MVKNEYVKNLMNQLKTQNFRKFGMCAQLNKCHIPGPCRLCALRDSSYDSGDKARISLYNELAELIGEPTLPQTHKITFADGKEVEISDESYRAMRGV